jgi:hypothetical protein
MKPRIRVCQEFGPTPTQQEIAAWIGTEANATPVFATGGLVSTNPTPIFDQLVAESDPDLFLAGEVFKRPTESLEAALIRIGHPAVQPLRFHVPKAAFQEALGTWRNTPIIAFTDWRDPANTGGNW